jgi:hypothetical protein
VTLQDLGNLGEFLGALGVIVSLVYLATQIRQYTGAVRRSVWNETVGEMSGFVALIGGDADTARVWELGLADSPDLSRADRLRFSLLLMWYLHAFARSYALHHERKIDPDFWEAHMEILRWIIKQPGVKRWWPTARAQIPANFADFVEREMG